MIPRPATDIGNILTKNIVAEIETKSTGPGYSGGAMSKGSVFTPETMTLLRDALEDAWAALRPDERARATRDMLAARLLELAAAGERDPARLRSEALSIVVTSPL